MNIPAGNRVAFSAGFFTLSGTVVSADGDMLQVKVDNGNVQPVSTAKVVCAYQGHSEDLELAGCCDFCGTFANK